jgi:hypothetical protein
MKQTAVDWLFNRLWETPKDKFAWQSILKEAKEREKMQIERANLNGASATLLHKFELGKYYKIRLFIPGEEVRKKYPNEFVFFVNHLTFVSSDKKFNPVI